MKKGLLPALKKPAKAGLRWLQAVHYFLMKLAICHCRFKQSYCGRLKPAPSNALAAVKISRLIFGLFAQHIKISKPISKLVNFALIYFTGLMFFRLNYPPLSNVRLTSHKSSLP